MAKVLKNYSVLIPVLVLVVMALSFGITGFNLGYYVDDWANVFVQLVKGPEATKLLHAYDGRPLQGWFRVVLFNILGFKPLVWQLFSLLLRYLVVIVSWLIFRRLWPKSELKLGLAAILFSVYPLFAQQQIALTYSGHWVAFFCSLLSIYLMVLSFEQPKLFIPFTLLGLLLSGFSLSIIEYFIGLEFVRPLLLWYASPKNTGDNKKKIIKIALYSLPYLAVAGFYVIWRIFLIDLPAPDRNELTLLGSILDSPIRAFIDLTLTVTQDLTTMLAATWYQTYQPGIFLTDDPINLFSLAIAFIVTIGMVWLFFRAVKSDDRKFPYQDSHWREQFTLGLIIIVFGILPGWMVGNHVSVLGSLWSDRFGIAAMSGAALCSIALILQVVRKPTIGLIIIASMIGLSSGWQIRNANAYRVSWYHQQNALSQMLWRIPAMKPNTLIITEYEFFSKMGGYPTAFGINTLYPQSSDTDQVDYWFETIPKAIQLYNGLESGVDVYDGLWQAKFIGSTDQVIVLYYRPSEDHCLWALNSDDILNPYVGKYSLMALEVSDLSRILPQAVDGFPKWEIFPEPEHNWCYYYQKADLAEQFKKWDDIDVLWGQAQDFLGSANAGVEFAPFINGFIHLNQYPTAIEITNRAAAYGEEMKPYLCDVWEKGLRGREMTTDDRAYVANSLAPLGCIGISD